ncbi:MAG: hypothetical protein K8S13_03070 [Desulfobacula sp.]|uniref:hypothetical protein n=1 Tax=Desulfobacula sp. TaxID=2593537 RepID=UPI0025C6EADF|nr:hypothetical protein [Desulfobacula sp.]MCD4718825.1 hypothetical protein [Desulfobacula sp.]
MERTLLNFYYRTLWIVILIGFVFLLPAMVTAKQVVGDIPVMPGAEIIKQSAYKGSTRLEQTMKATRVSSKISTASSRPLGSTSTLLSGKEIQFRDRVQHTTQAMHINPEDTRPESAQSFTFRLQ